MKIDHISYYWPDLSPDNTGYMEATAIRSYIDTTYNNLMLVTFTSDSSGSSTLNSPGYIYNGLYYIDENGYGHQINRYSNVTEFKNVEYTDPHATTNLIENQNIQIAEILTYLTEFRDILQMTATNISSNNSAMARKFQLINDWLNSKAEILQVSTSTTTEVPEEMMQNTNLLNN